MTRYSTFFLAAGAWLISTTSLVRADQAGPASTDRNEVTETIRAMYAALTADDLAKFRAVTAPGFYAFDGGERFTGDALVDLIKKAHAAGKVFVWTVNEPDVHITGETAWIGYVNNGSVKDGSGTKNLTWLESAFLQKEKRAWRIQFFHSTRAP